MCCTRVAANTGRKNDAKNRHLRTIAQLCPAMSSQLRHISTVGKNLLSSDISSRCPHNMVNFGPLAAEIGSSGSLGHPSYFQPVSHLGSITARYSSSGRQPNFAALNRGRHLYSAGRPSRWASAHILVGGSFNDRRCCKARDYAVGVLSVRPRYLCTSSKQLNILRLTSWTSCLDCFF